MAVAYLILAHSAPSQLARLVGALRHPEARFFIHVDKKADVRRFQAQLSGRDVVFVSEREDVRWGAYSMVQATLNGFRAILADGALFTHVSLLSGQDYPLVSAESICRFLRAHPRQSFMRYLHVETEWREAMPRLDRYHLTNYPIRGHNRLAGLLNLVLPKRTMPQNLVPVGRSQWFSITREAVAYIVGYLNDHQRVVRYFKLTWAPDEFIFQTLLYNSHLRPTLVNDDLRYVDWSEGKASPKVLTQADAELLLRSDKLLARKFDISVDSTILDLLDSRSSFVG
jgi:hypothetical protein